MVGLFEHKIWEVRLVEDLLAFEEGLCYLELVDWLSGCVVGWFLKLIVCSW